MAKTTKSRESFINLLQQLKLRVGSGEELERSVEAVHHLTGQLNDCMRQVFGRFEDVRPKKSKESADEYESLRVGSAYCVLRVFPTKGRPGGIFQTGYDPQVIGKLHTDDELPDVLDNTDGGMVDSNDRGQDSDAWDSIAEMLSRHVDRWLLLLRPVESEGPTKTRKSRSKGNGNRGPKKKRDLVADRKLMGDFKVSPLRRAEFCRGRGITVTDYDNAQRNVNRQKNQSA